MKRLILIAPASLGAVFALPAPSIASASVRSGSVSYYCTPHACAMDPAVLAPRSGPSFDPKPAPPITTHTLTFTYDPNAGVLTYTQSMPDTTPAYDPNYCNDWGDPSECVQPAATWASVGRFQLKYSAGSPGGGAVDKTLTFGAPAGVSTEDAQANWDDSGTQVFDSGYESNNELSETGVAGTLRPTATLNGNAVTFTWSSPLLHGLNLTQVTAAPASSNQGFDATTVPVNFYFPGLAPIPQSPHRSRFPRGRTVPRSIPTSWSTPATAQDCSADTPPTRSPGAHTTGLTSVA